MADDFFMDPNLPEELKEQILAARTRAEMEYDDGVHSIYRMVDEINVDHLKMLKVLLHGIGDNPQALGFWEGVFSQTIARRSGLCPACGRDHDKDLADMQSENDNAAQQADDLAARADVLITMAEYHVEPTDDDDLTGPVKCLGVLPGQGPCGLVYQDLTDRMVRKPDDCHGCFIRSSQG